MHTKILHCNIGSKADYCLDAAGNGGRNSCTYGAVKPNPAHFAGFPFSPLAGGKTLRPLQRLPGREDRAGGIGSLNQESSATDAVSFAGPLVGAAVRAAVKP
jgi:hypothetical protein